MIYFDLSIHGPLADPLFSYILSAVFYNADCYSKRVFITKNAVIFFQHFYSWLLEADVNVYRDTLNRVTIPHSATIIVQTQMASSLFLPFL